MKNQNKTRPRNPYSRLKTSLLLTTVSLILISCQRPTEKTLRVHIQIPEKKIAQTKTNTKLHPLNNQKECYAVSVSGPGINQQNLTCAPSVGLLVGFKLEGETLSLEVPQGSNRLFQVYMYQTDSSCPNLGEVLTNHTSGDHLAKLFMVGETLVSELRKAEEIVYIDIKDINNPSQENLWTKNSLGDSCPIALTPKALLFHSGKVTNADESLSLNHSLSPITQSLIPINTSSEFNLNDFIIQSTADQLITLNGSANDLSLPAIFKSYAPHPALATELLALDHGGNLWIVNRTTALSTQLSKNNCGLSACAIPLWMQSFSVQGQKIYGLDHAGSLYLLSESGDPVFIKQMANQSLAQVVF